MHRGLILALRVKAGWLTPPGPREFQGWTAPTGRAYIDAMEIIGETLEQRSAAPGGPPRGVAGPGATAPPPPPPDPMLRGLEDASEVLSG